MFVPSEEREAIVLLDMLNTVVARIQIYSDESIAALKRRIAEKRFEPEDPIISRFIDDICKTMEEEA